jgi:hypothetical protein
VDYKIVRESQGNRGSRPCNCPKVDNSDDDAKQLPDERYKVREQSKEEEAEEEVEEAQNRGAGPNDVNRYEYE